MVGQALSPAESSRRLLRVPAAGARPGQEMPPVGIYFRHDIPLIISHVAADWVHPESSLAPMSDGDSVACEKGRAWDKLPLWRFQMRRTIRRLDAVGLILTLMVTGSLHTLAQNRMNFSIVGQNGGHVALGLAIRKLGVYGAFMQAPAHPDDETNSLFAMFTWGMGLRSIDLQNNRGDGGQNEIGPELFRDMAVLRTSELLSAHRIDGAEQYFTRAIDYGYSFDPEEVIAKWGRKDIVGDYVRLWRTLRPDVIVTMNIQGRGGDRAHEATTVLVRESFRAAGDPSMYPEQIAEGLRPWQPKKLYFSGALAVPGAAPGGGRGGRGGGAAQGTDAAKLTPVTTDTYDPLLGRTYAEI